MANISYRFPSFRTEPVPVPSISTLPRKWPTSTPVQATRTASSSSAHRHVVTVELPPYFEAANVSSFSPDSAARNRMADSGRYVDQWNTSRSTPDLAAVSDLQLLSGLTDVHVNLRVWVCEGYTSLGMMMSL